MLGTSSIRGGCDFSTVFKILFQSGRLFRLNSAAYSLVNPKRFWTQLSPGSIIVCVYMAYTYMFKSIDCGWHYITLNKKWSANQLQVHMLPATSNYMDVVWNQRLFPIPRVVGDVEIYGTQRRGVKIVFVRLYCKCCGVSRSATTSLGCPQLSDQDP